MMQYNFLKYVDSDVSECTAAIGGSTLLISGWQDNRKLL